MTRRLLRPYPHPNPRSAPRPGPRLRRGRSQPRAPVARKPCLLAPKERGFRQNFTSRLMKYCRGAPTTMVWL
ncbi:hypothetical protein FFY45_04440 [Xanthomonas hortorum]|nr:hypothetical protein [Xanthomonas hortorum]